MGIEMEYGPGYACIARTQGYDPRQCGRTAPLLGPGDQPFCWQHSKNVERALQQLHLGITRLLPADVIVLHAPDAEPCVALVDNEFNVCGEPAAHANNTYGRHIGLAADQPLCAIHIASLTESMRKQWKERISRSGSRAPWGWQEAEAYGLSLPPERAERAGTRVVPGSLRR